MLLRNTSAPNMSHLHFSFSREKSIIIQPIWWDLPLVEFLCTVCHVSSPLIYIYGCCQRHLVPPYSVVYVNPCILWHIPYVHAYAPLCHIIFSLFSIDFLVSHCVLISFFTWASLTNYICLLEKCLRIAGALRLYVDWIHLIYFERFLFLFGIQ